MEFGGCQMATCEDCHGNEFCGAEWTDEHNDFHRAGCEEYYDAVDDFTGDDDDDEDCDEWDPDCWWDDDEEEECEWWNGEECDDEDDWWDDDEDDEDDEDDWEDECMPVCTEAF